MAETIESFVAKLQKEGVEAGRKEAERIKAEAEAEARKTLQDAKNQAESIVKEAEAKAQDILQKGQEELALAARDAVLKLRETLNRALQTLLSAQVKEALSEQQFLRELIRDVVLQYAKQDGAGQTDIKINLRPELQETLGRWVVEELKKAIDGSASIDIRGTLEEAGFEYTVTGGVVEITVDSVVETLSELVGDALREKLDRAVKVAEA